MRTLVVSDLHLGARTGRDLLRRAEVREPLLGELHGVDRLVLLGDVLELRHGPVREALSAAEPVLREIAEALGPGSEVVLVPGNHDHHLLGAWLERRARGGMPPPLGLEMAVDWHAGETLATITGWLAPAEVRVAYPGVWLREDVYATHGHYCDRHTTVPMFERLGAGAMARIVHELPAGPQRPEDYEAVLAPIYAWLHAIAQSGGPNLGRSSHGASAQAWRALEGDRAHRGRRRALRRRAVRAAFSVALAALNRTRIGPVRADLSGVQLRRAALLAFGEVLVRLHVDAGQVIFGHTHRAGPLPGDDRTEWLGASGAQLVNTGSWVHEPGFIGSRPRESPYRPGFCAALADEGPAALTNLLDGLILPAPG